jgi:hypothetical protein
VRRRICTYRRGGKHEKEYGAEACTRVCPRARWSNKLNGVTRPAFPRTLLVYTCCPEIIIKRTFLLLGKVSKFP